METQAETTEPIGRLRVDIAPKCELCHDQTGEPEKIVLHGRCHMSAPSWVEIDEGFLVVKCYLPDCQREIARFEIVRG